jgi:hypothetical protein
LWKLYSQAAKAETGSGDGRILLYTVDGHDCAWHTRLSGEVDTNARGLDRALQLGSVMARSGARLDLQASITNAAASLHHNTTPSIQIMSDAHAPLTWESSTGTQPQLATSLPGEVVNCLENARYVRPPHLDARCPACADLHTSSTWQPAQSCNLTLPS